MNYFKILKVKEEELELLKKNLEEITKEYRKCLKDKLEIGDLYNKEINNLETLNKSYEEEYKKENIMGIMVLFIIISVIILVLVFNLFSALLYKTFLVLGLINLGEIMVSLKIINYVSDKYKNYREENKDIIYLQQVKVAEIDNKKKLIINNYQKILEDKLKLSKEVDIKARELEILKEEVLKAFYPFLIHLCDKGEIKENLEYQEALKRIRKL